MPGMEQIMGGGGAAGAAPAMSPPSGAPAMGEQQPSGDIERAKSSVQMAIVMLEQALPMIGSGSEEGQVLVKALSALSKKFSADASQDMIPAEMMGLMSGMPDQYKQQAMKEMGGGQAPAPGMPS